MVRSKVQGNSCVYENGCRKRQNILSAVYVGGMFLVMPHGTKGLGRLLFHSILGGETSKCTERVAVCVKGGLGRKLEEWPLRLHIGR